MVELTLIVGIISTAMQAIQTWIAVRDRDSTVRALDEGIAAAQVSAEIRVQSEALMHLVPPPILKILENRVQRCWDDFEVIVRGSRPSDEIDQATQKLKRCICRELNRILDLNDTIPEGVLQDWWQQYCQA